MARKTIRLLLCAAALGYIVYAGLRPNPVWLVPVWAFMSAMSFWAAWSRRRQGMLLKARFNAAIGLLFLFTGLVTMTRASLPAVIGMVAMTVAAIVLLFQAQKSGEPIV